MRRMYCLIAAVLAAACLCFPAEVRASGEPARSGQVWDLEETGIRYEIPPEIADAEGLVTYIYGVETAAGSGVYLTEILYLGMTEDEYLSYDADTASEEEQEMFRTSVLVLANLFAIDRGRNDKAVISYFRDYGIELADLTEIGRVGEYTFYLEDKISEHVDGLREGYAEEYLRLAGDRSLITDYITLSEPVGASAVTGEPLQFETKDIDGNAVSSLELFAQHEITMVNVWTSWCIYCIEEMPELEKLNREFAEKDAAIIGLLYDGADASALRDAEAVIEEAQVTYPTLLPWSGMEKMFPVRAYPTTFFVDREGKIIGEPIEGALLSQYKETMEYLLSGVE